MNARLEEIYREYLLLLKDVEGEFNRVSSMFSDRMQCRKGCSMCCSQLFGISFIEAAYISHGAKGLAEDEQALMRERAKAYLEEMLGISVDETQGIEEHGARVTDALKSLAGARHIPCPALVDDACIIYDHRPIIARKWGIPIWNPRKPDVLQACELNFKAGEAIAVEGLVEPQVELEYRWLMFKERVGEDLELPDVVATVASAVIFDYEGELEKAVWRRPQRASGA